MSTLAYKGSLSIGGLCPLVVSAQAGVLANLQARIAGLIALSAKMSLTPPSITVGIDFAVKLKAALEAALSLGVVFPSLSIQIAALASLVAQLEAQVAIVLQLQALFGAAGVHVWEFEGVGPDLGPLLTSALAAGWPDGSSRALPANAVVLATTTPATWTAMKTFFGGA